MHSAHRFVVFTIVNYKSMIQPDRLEESIIYMGESINTWGCRIWITIYVDNNLCIKYKNVSITYMLTNNEYIYIYIYIYIYYIYIIKFDIFITYLNSV